jgi:OOP family OmpA-OmpF porin
MQAITAKRVFIFVIAVFSMSLLVGCSGLVKRPEYRSGYLYYPPALVNADRALDEARAAGKDRECPAEFNALKDTVDKAYEVYMACHTQEAIDMAQEAIGKIKALCPAPPTPTCELTSAPEEIEQGQSATLRLTTSGKVKSAMLDGTEVAATGGTKTVSPNSTTSYTAKVAGPAGSTTCSVTVTVTVPPPPPPPPPPAARVIDRLTIHVNFDFDKSNIRKADEAELEKAIDFVRKYPGAKVELEGHTDGKGTEQYNQKLSERRAEAVRQYLIKEGAVDKAMISARGYGKTKPIAPNKTKDGKDDPEGRAKNRRVEILIISE